MLLFSMFAAAVVVLPFVIFPFYHFANVLVDKHLAVRMLNDQWPEGKPDDFELVFSHGRCYDRHGKRVRRWRELGYKPAGPYAIKME